MAKTTTSDSGHSFDNDSLISTTVTRSASSIQASEGGRLEIHAFPDKDLAAWQPEAGFCHFYQAFNRAQSRDQYIAK